MKKLIPVIITLVWFGGSFALLAMKVFGVCGYSWWWATLGFWAPAAFVLFVVALVSAVMYLTHLVRYVSESISRKNQ